MKKKKKRFLYSGLADRIQKQIKSGSFKISEKLPSLRSLCRETGYSMTTVFQAYIELEKRGIVESRHRSGYFIKPRLGKLRQQPEMKHHDMVPEKIRLDDLIHQLTEDLGDPKLLKLGSLSIAFDHLPYRQLYKHLKSIPRERAPEVITGYVHPQGDATLRQQISNLLFTIIPPINMEDMIITNGCTEALSLSLRAVSSPGDTIMVESPADPWIRQAIKDSDMFALEIPTDPVTGMDLTSVGKIITREKIASCIINPNCQNPLGFIMPDDHKKTLIAMLADKKIPIIENDVSGELYFGEHRPSPLKKWDNDENILYCSSFSKVLAPGLRIGWVVPGQYKEKILRMKLNRSLVSPTLNQVLVASYLKEGTYHRHLRKLRETLKIQYAYCAASLSRHFPETIRMTTPAGGQSIWIELPKGVKGRDVYSEARKKGISILPGFLCTNFDTFDHFIRISYGGKWDTAADQAIQTLGEIIKGLS